MKLKSIILPIIIIVFIAVTIFFFFEYRKIKDFKIVGEYIFELYDSNELTDFTYTSDLFLQEFQSNEKVCSVIKRHPERFSVIYIMSENEIAFQSENSFTLKGNTGYAVIRNNALPLKRSENAVRPKEMSYIKIYADIYKYYSGD